jgi:hypothetical protein
MTSTSINISFDDVVSGSFRTVPGDFQLTSSSCLCSLPSAAFEDSFGSNWPWERSSTNSALVVDDAAPLPYGTSGWVNLSNRRKRRSSYERHQKLLIYQGARQNVSFTDRN